MPYDVHEIHNSIKKVPSNYFTQYCFLESVGCQGKVNNFKTFGAFKSTLVKVFSAVSEANFLLFFVVFQ